MDSSSQHSRTGGAKEGGKAEREREDVRRRSRLLRAIYIYRFYNVAVLKNINKWVNEKNLYSLIIPLKDKASLNNTSTTLSSSLQFANVPITRSMAILLESVKSLRFLCSKALKRALLLVYGPLEREHVIKYHFLNDIVMWRGREGSKCPRFVADGKSSTRKSIIDHVYYIRRTISKVRFKNEDVAQVRDEHSRRCKSKMFYLFFFFNDSCNLHCKK
uniref:Uncharacterized protein n=1 Tax=Trichogramma kaykai TaxID=54128 RepID=A0ABD2VVH3_9HYME